MIRDEPFHRPINTLQIIDALPSLTSGILQTVSIYLKYCTIVDARAIHGGKLKILCSNLRFFQRESDAEGWMERAADPQQSQTGLMKHDPPRSRERVLISLKGMCESDSANRLSG